MITIEEALRLITEKAKPLGVESVPVSRCAGRILAKEIIATEDLPPFDNSAMDGFAVRRKDLEGASENAPVRLRVGETVRAGGGGQGLREGEAVRIMTGAPVPAGADAVVMKERAEAGSATVAIAFQPEPGNHIRWHGEDVRAGQILLKVGTALRPYEAALLAAQGLSSVPVVRKPRVAIIASGDELVGADAPLCPGQIRNSNGPAMAAALHRWGVEVEDLGIVRDDRAVMKEVFRKALEADLVLVSGGVSVGDFDFTKPVMKELGVKEVFWKISVKPGKPLFFGALERSGGPARLVFGLPGNPVSVLVGLEEFVRPALEGLEGRTPRHASYHLKGKVVNLYPKPKDRLQFIFCKASRGEGGDYELEIIRPQGSAMMGMVTQANALARGPLGTAQIKPGDILDFRWLK